MRYFRTVKATPEANKGAILESGRKGYYVTHGAKKLAQTDVYLCREIVEKQPEWFEEVMPVYLTKGELNQYKGVK